MIQVTPPTGEEPKETPPKAELLSAVSGLTVVGLGLLAILYLYSTGHLTYQITTAYGPTRPEIINISPDAIIKDLIKTAHSLKNLLSP